MGKYHNIQKITLPLLEFNHSVYKPCSSVAEEQLQRTFLLLGIVLLTISQCELDLLLSGLESRRAERLASGRLLVDCSPRTQLAVDCPESEACQQSSRTADVDCQHKIDTTGVLHLDLGGDELSRGFMQEGE